MSNAVRPEELAAVEMLATLPAVALEELAERARRRDYAAGEAVFHEGDPGESLHVVTAGLLKVVRPSTGDPDLVLQTLKPGHGFGELAVLNSGPRTATVAAIDHSQVVEVSKADFDAVLDRHPAAVRAMFGALANSLTQAKELVARQNQALEETVRERTEELRETRLEVIERLAQAAEFRDEDTGLHIARMSRLSQRLALAAGLGEAESEILLNAAPMHDIGKIGIPDAVLLKPGKLDDEEWAIMKTHTTIGGRILSGSGSELVRMGREIALAHHERWDGGGYPNGLDGDAIPLVARICSVADVFDALTSERPYKKAWPREEALGEIEAQSGKLFDPHLAECFIGLGDEIDEVLALAAEEERRKGMAGAGDGAGAAPAG